MASEGLGRCLVLRSVPGLQPFLLGAQWPLGKRLFPPSSCAIHSSCTSWTFWAGWCVPRRKWQEVGWELFRLTWAWGTGRKACRALCLPKPAAPRSGEGCAPSPSPTPPRPASLDARLPLPLAPAARGQPQMAPWPGDKGHTVSSPGLASGWVTLSPSVPIWGWGQTPQGDRPFSCLPSPATPRSEELTLPREK